MKIIEDIKVKMATLFLGRSVKHTMKCKGCGKTHILRFTQIADTIQIRDFSCGD